jgi:cytochrome c oxidase subunit 2
VEDPAASLASWAPDAIVCRSPSNLRARRRFASFARVPQPLRRSGDDGRAALARDRGAAGAAPPYVIEDRMIRNRRGSATPRLIGRALAALGALPFAALAAPAWNFQPPVTPIAREQFDLHLYIFWICVVIFIGVFGVLFYSLLKHRKSVGHQAAQFHENTTVEIVWTVIPFLILLFMAYPASKTILALKDTSAPDMTIKVTGYQWKWNYDYLEDGFGFYSTLSTPFAQIENREPKGEHYLLEVDHPLVVPVDTKVRVLITAGDVIHSWWVPAFGVKQDAIPGFVRDSWFKADKVGIYRGQCAELCGKEHGFMPIVVEVKSKDDYAKWAADQKKAMAAAADDPHKVWDQGALVARGEKVFNANCAACHQAAGTGNAAAKIPALVGDPVVLGPAKAQIDTVLNGRNAMPSWKQLSDTDIAAAITYTRNSWGNKAAEGLVQPAAVEAERK